jgi:hypothetical protein
MQSVGSREYKLMLRPSKFKGDETELLESTSKLWSALAAIIVTHAVAVSGTADTKTKRREVSFLDTADHWLRSHDYVLRQRVDQDSDERKVTLKFRHPDRYISQDRDMSPADDLEKDMKFEEDIKPEFLKLYSFSSNTIPPADTKLTTLADVAALYPGLPAAVDEFPETEKLRKVGGFTAYERVVKGTGFQIRKDPEVIAECSVTIWYTGKSDDTPVVAEFSFKYEGDEKTYSAKMAQRAYNAFMAIQSQLGSWVEPKSITKTGYAYSLSK